MTTLFRTRTPSFALLVLKEFVLDGIHEGFPTGFDDVGVDSDRAPCVCAVGTLDDYARLGGGAARAVEDAHLVVDELHIGDRRIEIQERRAQCLVQRVNGTIAGFLGMHSLSTEPHIYPPVLCCVFLLSLDQSQR